MGFFCHVRIAKVSRVKWTFIFSVLLIFNRVMAIQVLKNMDFLEKKCVFIFFPKTKSFLKKIVDANSISF